MASPKQQSQQVDSLLPRVKAGFHALIPAAAYLVGPPSAPWILGFTCLAMSLSVLLGPKFSLFGRLARAIRPFLKSPGKPESLAPHRFAEAVGAVFLGAAAAAYGTGLLGVGGALALVVVALAVLNAAAGICVGCQFYLLAQRLRPAEGWSPNFMIGRLLVLVVTSALSLGAAYALRDWFRGARLPSRVDRRDFTVPDARPALALFTSPYCHECQVALPILRQASQVHDTNLVVIDARQRPDLLAKYAIRSTPTILVVDARGQVTAGWHTSPSEHQLAAALG